MFSAITFHCPTCQTTLKKQSNDYHCPRCSFFYKETAGVINFLPAKLDDIKKIEVETYSYRAQFFKAEEALQVGRPAFTDPLRKQGKDGWFLELCGGAAHHALNLMKDGYKVIESDIAPGSVKRAKDFADHLKIGANGLFTVIDAEHLPFADNSFNGVFLISALHHLPHPNRALSEIYRVLKPGGVVLIGYEPNTWHYYALYPLFRLARFVIRQRSKHPISVADDVTFGFSKSSLRRLLIQSGFKVERITPVDLLDFVYKKSFELFNKIFKSNLQPSITLRKLFKKLDQLLFKIPGVDLLAINYDILGKK